MRPATDPADDDWAVVLRARRAERGLLAVLTVADVVVVFLAALVVVGLRAAGFFTEALATEAFAAGAFAVEAFTAARFLAAGFLAAGFLAAVFLAADGRPGLPVDWRLRWLNTITHSSSLNEEGLLPWALASLAALSMS